MLTPRKILYIIDYDFGESHDHRNKYLIVLHRVNEISILVSLTTSKDHVPDKLLESGGRCFREEENNIHSFFFPKDKVVCERGFSFSKNTFIDVNKSQVFQKETAHIATKYIDTGLVEEVGFLTNEEYHELLYCISKARHIPLGIKRRIEEMVKQFYSEK